ncbi:MAG: nucleotidyltransferase family protein [Thermoanaerobaculia bacterium]
MWGVIPAAGRGSRIQPLAFSKELLPVGAARQEDGERPRAVSEYLVERMLLAGADKLCFVISPEKADIVQYFGGTLGGVPVAYVVQPRPEGLCDALFQALPLIAPQEEVLAGLPDTVWFPETGYRALDGPGDGGGELVFLLFPVDRPEHFDAVVTGDGDRVVEIQVKRQAADSHWVWGAFRMSGRVLARLHELWLRRDRRDEYVGTLVNAYLSEGGSARGVRAGETYVDVGTLEGFRAAQRLLEGHP